MQDAGQPNQPQRQVTAEMFAARYRSKKECYNFLVCNVGAFLPPSHTDVTTYFLADLACGRKSFVRADQIRHIACPLYPGLRSAELLSWAEDYPIVMQHLCEPQDRHRLPRAYIATLIFTLVGQPFANYVQTCIKIRNNKVMADSNKVLGLDPGVAKAFWESSDVSTRHGSSWCAFKPGHKRRRTQAEMHEQISSEQLKKIDERENEQRILELEAQLEQMGKEAENNKNAAAILTNLIESGDCEMDNDGSVSVSKKKHVPNVIGNMGGGGF